MIIRQEEESPIEDLYINSHLNTAFNGIAQMAGDTGLDSELLKTYCEETVKLLKKFIQDIETVERKEEKRINREKFKQKLSLGDSLD